MGKKQLIIIGKYKVRLVTVPSYRYRDLEREIDLIEKVARLYGYDHFTDTLPVQSQVGYIPSSYQIQRHIRSNTALLVSKTFW